MGQQEEVLPGEELKESREGTFERLRKEWNTPPLGLLSAALPDGWAGEAVDAAAAKAVRSPDLFAALCPDLFLPREIWRILGLCLWRLYPLYLRVSVV